MSPDEASSKSPTGPGLQLPNAVKAPDPVRVIAARVRVESRVRKSRV